MKRYILSLLIIFVWQSAYTQRKIVEKATIPMFSFSYGFQVPSGDISNRFGTSSMVGADFSIKFKNNWVLGAEYRFLFGGDVKENTILDGISTSNGYIINQYGEYAKVLISERGFYSGVSLGKIFTVNKSTPNSGIYVKLGAGLLQHKINIENQSNNAPQILDDYKKGYDRLTNGFAANGFLGYLYIGEKQLSNFYAGFDITKSWTQSRRDFDFDTMVKDESKRKDDLIGFKIGWIIPLYRRVPDNYFTY